MKAILLKLQNRKELTTFQITVREYHFLRISYFLCIRMACSIYKYFSKVAVIIIKKNKLKRPLIPPLATGRTIFNIH